MDAGVLGRIKPIDPARPGCVAMFPDRNTDIMGAGTYYIADKVGEDYTITVLDDATLEQARTFYMDYAQSMVTKPRDLRVHIYKPSAAVNN